MAQLWDLQSLIPCFSEMSNSVPEETTPAASDADRIQVEEYLSQDLVQVGFKKLGHDVCCHFLKTTLQIIDGMMIASKVICRLSRKESHSWYQRGGTTTHRPCMVPFDATCDNTANCDEHRWCSLLPSSIIIPSQPIQILFLEDLQRLFNRKSEGLTGLKITFAVF